MDLEFQDRAPRILKGEIGETMWTSVWFPDQRLFILYEVIIHLNIVQSRLFNRMLYVYYEWM